jgi:diguanylate cyclase (GGDEF)-like protein
LLLAVAILGPVLVLVLYRLSIRTALEAGRLAFTDGLTGLGNDRRFLDRLERDLDRAESDGDAVAVYLIDVDDFKLINDRYGHAAGDRVLVEVAASLRRGGEAFRLGGDEFALLVPRPEGADVLAVAESVVGRMAAVDAGHGSVITVSVGVAVYPEHGLRRSELMRAADDALYRAKVAGKNCARVYEPDGGESRELHRNTPVDGRAALHHAAAGLARAIRARGIESGAGDLAGRVAARMGLAAEHVELIRLAGMVNDVGKLALPDELLTKPGPLTAAERGILQRHPQIGFQLLESLGADPVATWVLHHHERWDGRGYPERLAGERIPLGARILFVADAYDAMTSDQSWRPRLSREEALAELERCAGTQFDPAVVAAFAAELGPAAEDELSVAVSA